MNPYKETKTAFIAETLLITAKRQPHVRFIGYSKAKATRLHRRGNVALEAHAAHGCEAGGPHFKKPTRVSSLSISGWLGVCEEELGVCEEENIR